MNDCRRRLSLLLTFVGQMESEIESIRQGLAKLPEFEPYTVFKIYAHKGLMSKHGLYKLLKQNGYIEVQTRDFEQVIKYFDLHDRNKLDYHDFL